MYDTIIFDLDGTIIDSMNIWEEIDRKFLEKRNIQIPKDYIEKNYILNSDCFFANIIFNTKKYKKQNMSILKKLNIQKTSSTPLNKSDCPQYPIF